MQPSEPKTWTSATVRCPSVFVYNLGWGRGKRSVQCKHADGHDGRHAQLGELGMGDTFWDFSTVEES